MMVASIVSAALAAAFGRLAAPRDCLANMPSSKATEERYKAPLARRRRRGAARYAAAAYDVAARAAAAAFRRRRRRRR